MILMLVMLIAAFPAGRAEETSGTTIWGAVDLRGFDALGEAAGIRARDMMEQLLTGRLRVGSFDIDGMMKKALSALKNELAGVLLKLLVPVLAWLLLRTLMGGAPACDSGAGLLCRLCCIRVMLGVFAGMRAAAVETLDRTVEATRAVSPVLASVLTVTGGSCAILTPASALCAAAVENALRGVCVPLCGVAASIAAASNLPGRFRLTKLFNLFRRGIAWMIGALAAGFAFMLSAQGIAAAQQDALAANAVGRVLSGMVPLIGRKLSGAADLVGYSSRAIRGAAGVTGAALLLAACAGPAIRLATAVASVKLSAAIVEPAADKDIAGIIEQFASVGEMLLAICAAAVVLSLLTIGAAISGAGNLFGMGA